MKKTTLGLIICSIIGGVLLIVGVIVSIFQGFNGIKELGSAWNGVTDKVNGSFALTEEVGNIQVDAEAGKVSVLFTNDETIAVEYAESRAIKVNIKKEGDTLFVKQKIRNFLLKSNGGEIIVKIPYSMVNLNYGLSLDAGQIEVSGITGRTCEAECDAGKVLFKDCVFKNLFIEVSAGDLKAELIRADVLEAEVDVGQADVEILGEKTHYTLRGEVDLGKTNFSNQTGTVEGKRISITVDIGDANLKFSTGDE